MGSKVQTAVILLVSAGASVSAGSSLYSQTSDRTDQQSFFSDAVPGQFFSQRMADNFTLDGAASVTGIAWWGGSQNFQSTDVGNMVSWTVVLYEADGLGNVDGSTAIDLGTYTFGESNATATGATLFGGGIEYRHEIAFDALDLTAGDYWLSIGATLEETGGDAWVWSGSTQGDLVNATDFFDGGGFLTFNPTFNDLAFEVIGVPAPGAAAPLAMLLAVSRRRR